MSTVIMFVLAQLAVIEWEYSSKTHLKMNKRETALTLKTGLNYCEFYIFKYMLIEKRGFHLF